MKHFRLDRNDNRNIDQWPRDGSCTTGSHAVGDDMRPSRRVVQISQLLPQFGLRFQNSTQSMWKDPLDRIPKRLQPIVGWLQGILGQRQIDCYKSV